MIMYFLKLTVCKILTTLATWQLWQKEETLRCENSAAKGDAEHYTELFSVRE